MSRSPKPATAEPTPDEAPPRPAAAVAAVVAVLVLIAAVGLLALLLGGRDAGAGSDAVAGIRENRVQAVYMTNDDVFFGDLRTAEGDWVQLKDAYFLRSAANGARKEEAELQVVSVAQGIGGDGDLLINAREILRVQNLAADSDIAGAIEDATD